MNSPGNMVFCPSCGKRYSLSDFKSDRLVCSACGREIPRILSIGNVDEAKYVKQFFKRCMWEEMNTYVVAFPIGFGFFLWICTRDISFWWKIVPGIFLFGFPIIAIMEARHLIPIYRIFSKNNYRLSACKQAYQTWFNSLTHDQQSDVPSTFKKPSFLNDLENYVMSHAEINQTYEQVNGQRLGTQSSFYYVIPGGNGGTVRYDEYDYPPERCPGCGKLYGIADFSSDRVQCRHCGKTVLFKHCVTNQELNALCMELHDKIKRQHRFTLKSMAVIEIILLISALIQILVVGPFVYLSSWHFLTGFFFLTFLVALYFTAFSDWQYKMLSSSLKSNEPDLLSVEIILKRTASKHRKLNSEEAIAAEFKRKLFDLYRSKGKVIGRY